MNEAMWLTTDNFFDLKRYLWETKRKHPRKYRLAGCHLYRQFCHESSNQPVAALLDLAERYADNPNLREQVRSSCDESSPLPLCVLDPSIAFDDYDILEIGRVISFSEDRLAEQWDELHPAISDIFERDQADPLRQDWAAFTDRATTAGAALLRELFGNPFRPAAFQSEWQTDTVQTLAHQMYDSRDFSAMPILADALQDAGCENDDILNHCRGAGPHVRGCWVVDAILGKA